MAEINWSEEAETCLKGILDCIAEDNPFAAPMRFGGRLLQWDPTPTHCLMSGLRLVSE